MASPRRSPPLRETADFRETLQILELRQELLETRRLIEQATALRARRLQKQQQHEEDEEKRIAAAERAAEEAVVLPERSRPDDEPDEEEPGSLSWHFRPEGRSGNFEHQPHWAARVPASRSVAWHTLVPPSGPRRPTAAPAADDPPEPEWLSRRRMHYTGRSPDPNRGLTSHARIVRVAVTVHRACGACRPARAVEAAGGRGAGGGARMAWRRSVAS